MEKLKTKAEHLHAVVHELASKDGPLERASLAVRSGDTPQVVQRLLMHDKGACEGEF